MRLDSIIATVDDEVGEFSGLKSTGISQLLTNHVIQVIIWAPFPIKERLTCARHPFELDPVQL